MKCGEVRSLFSPYLDGAVTGIQMHALSQHLEICSRCNREYLLLRRSQQLLTGLGRRKAPADLALKLRVAISQEVAQAKRPPFQGVVLRMENAGNAFMVPVTAGLVSAVVIFGIVIGVFALPEPSQRNTDDVPWMLHTAPHVRHRSFGPPRQT